MKSAIIDESIDQYGKIFPQITVDDYEQYVGAEVVDRIHRKAEALKGLHVCNVNSTYYGGGVAEMLSGMTLLMASLGIRVGWRLIQGSPDYFTTTKKMHNALQGADINLSELKKEIYEATVYQNALRNHLNHDFVIIHDYQPLPLIRHFKRKGPWIWRCHIDISTPNRDVWSYLKPFVDRYDAVVLSLREFRQEVEPPQYLFMPAIDPFSLKNRQLSPAEERERLEHYGVPLDKPLVVQVSRFDPWKDPLGVIEAFKLARREVDAVLVLAGGPATDDPEGEVVYDSLLNHRRDDIILISHEDSALVNALQSRAAVVVQKSLKEGFGLTVTEAMWKGTPVIGGDVGGIHYQIEDGVSGYLVSSVEETAARMVALLKDPRLRDEMGRRARERVARNFLHVRLLEQWVDLFRSLEKDFSFAMEPGQVQTLI